MTPKRQHVTLRPSRPGTAPWEEQEGDTLKSGALASFEGFDDEADTMTEQAPLAPASSKAPGAATDANAKEVSSKID